MEIHNECVRDLLSVDSTPLRLVDDTEVRPFFSLLGENVFIYLVDISIVERNHSRESHRGDLEGPRSCDRATLYL